MNGRVIRKLQMLSSIEEQQKKSGHFCEDLPDNALQKPTATNQKTRTLSNYFFRNKDIYVSKHNRYAAYPEHQHTFLEMNYMLRGEAHEVVNGTPIILQQGDLLLIDVGASHSIDALGYNDILINVLFRDKNISINLLNDLNRTKSVLYEFLLDRSINEAHTNGEPNFLVFRYERNHEVQRTLEHIIDEYYLKRQFADTIIKSYLSILIAQLVRNYQLPTKQASSPTQKIIVNILQEISTNYRDISLDEIAKRNNYNRNYLGNLFKQVVGKTFTESVTQQRLISAHTLISSTSLPISAIMEKVGFSNTTAFYKKYRAFYHSLPSQDRNLNNWEKLI